MKLKHTLSLLPLAICAAASTSALAQTGTIDISGTLTSTGCTPTLSGSVTGTTVNLDSVSVTALTGGVGIGEKPFTFDFTGCDVIPSTTQVWVHFSGSNVDTASGTAGYIIPTIGSTNVRFRYQTCDIHELPESELMEMENPFSIVVLACRASLLEGKLSDPELNKIRIGITKKMLRQGYGKDRTERFLHFLWNIVHTSDPGVNREYMQEIGILTEGTIDMNTIELARKHGFEDGVQQGLQQGIQKGRLEGLEKANADKLMFALNFKRSGFPIREIAKNLGLRPEDIERL